MTESERIAQAVADIRSRTVTAAPVVGIVLGSGLGAVADRVEARETIPYGEISGFQTSGVEGHAGRLCLGTFGGRPCAVMQGRIHLYEGHAAEDVVRPVRVLIALGARKIIVTNAAGGINATFRVGDLMLISDHLNLTGRNPLMGKNDDARGPRFPDMSEAYSGALRRRAREVAARLGARVCEGVYAGLLGPSYETPAEIRMLRTLGADAVGMSTVLEVIAARHAGADVLGISCISNAAAGMGEGQLSHDEVKAAADSVQESLTDLLSGVVQNLP